MRDAVLKQLETYIANHAEAERRNDWRWLADEMYTEDALYICEYAGAMLVRAEGRDQIKNTHYGRDMAHGWQGWAFPYINVYANDDGTAITHWMNRGPGKRADGSYFETPGVSFIRFNDELMIENQLDLFDLAHQMKLCDELEEVGLLSEQLKKDWVIPMKSKLVEQLKF